MWEGEEPKVEDKDKDRAGAVSGHDGVCSVTAEWMTVLV